MHERQAPPRRRQAIDPSLVGVETRVAAPTLSQAGKGLKKTHLQSICDRLKRISGTFELGLGI